MWMNGEWAVDQTRRIRTGVDFGVFDMCDGDGDG